MSTRRRNIPWSLCSLALCALSAACGPGEDPAPDMPVYMPPVVDMPAMTSPADMPGDMNALDLGAGADLPDYDGPLIKDNPRGLAWPNSPTQDEQTEQVVLSPPLDPLGALDAPGYSVYLCANEDGEELYIDGMMIGALCTETQRARPERGEYLHLRPPEDMSSGNDSFSEVHTYFHMAKISEYFSQTLGWERAPEHIPVVTNFQYKLTQAGALEVGGRVGWNPVDNAYYIEPDGFAGLGAAPRETSALVFGQGARADYSYDTSIIYHEYTHSIIGTEAFRKDFVDLYGINTTPRAINEGLADFFAASFRQDPLIGAFAFAPSANLVVRDVSIKRTCPEDVVGQYHSDGLIVASMLWHLREVIGEDALMPLILHALSSADMTTGFDMFARLLSAEAAIASPDIAREVNAAIEEWGLKGCDRARPIGTFQANVDAASSIRVPGLQDVEDPVFTDWVPGYIQFVVKPPPGKSVQLTWYMETTSITAPPSKLDIALKRRAPLRLSTEGGVASLDEDAFFEVPIENISAQTITFPPECLAEGDEVYLLIRNSAPRGASITFLAAYELDVATEGRNVVSCSP